MDTTSDLIRRGKELQHELVEFAQRGRFEPVLRHVLTPIVEPVNQSDGTFTAANDLDHFILQHRLADGLTVVEHFVNAHPELPEAERTLLLGWRDVVEGIFRVEDRQGDTLGLLNLVDDLRYRVYANTNRRVFAAIAAGSFLIGRVVPIDDVWLVSGAVGVLPEAQSAEAYRLAAELALQQPALAFRNPTKLEQAATLQLEERERFLAFFGSDLVVVAGCELADRMQAYHHFLLHEHRDATGKTAAERAEEISGVAPQVPSFVMPESLQGAQTVGLIFDEVDGLSFLIDFGILLEAFTHPERSKLRRFRTTVLRYLKDSTTSPRLLRRLAAQDPQRASMVFQYVLKQPRFSWERDGEALLQQYKASYFATPVLPTVAPVSGAVARARLLMAAGGALTGDHNPVAAT